MRAQTAKHVSKNFRTLAQKVNQQSQSGRRLFQNSIATAAESEPTTRLVEKMGGRKDS